MLLLSERSKVTTQEGSRTSCLFGNQLLDLIEIGEEFTVKIKVEPGQNGISAAEIRLSFDPKAIELIDIQKSPESHS